MLQMDISEGCPTLIYPLVFIHVVSMILLVWSKCFKSDCMALVARLKSTNAQVVFFLILSVRCKCPGGRRHIHQVQVWLHDWCHRQTCSTPFEE